MTKTGKNNPNYKGESKYMTAICPQCNNEFKVLISEYNHVTNDGNKKYCSIECYRDYRRSDKGKAESSRVAKENALHGEQLYNWKGGISPLNVKIRSCGDYNTWRKGVFQRDLYACQRCGIGGGSYVTAHHILSFSDIIQKYGIDSLDEALECEELWSIDNGITLCKDCHKKEHKKLKAA